MNPGIPVIPEMFRIFNFWRKMMMMKMMKAARLYIYFPYGEISNKWWDNLINERMHKDAWKNSFRMSKENFYELVSLILSHAKLRSDRLRKDIITLEKRFAGTLYYLKDR